MAASKLNASEHGVEQVSAHRFTDSEIIVLEDGERLVWQNSDPSSPKCRCEVLEKQKRGRWWCCTHMFGSTSGQSLDGVA